MHRITIGIFSALVILICAKASGRHFAGSGPISPSGTVPRAATTTIVQNKILSIICSANIYRPSLGKVQLGRPNPKPIPPLNLYLRRKKKTILPQIVCTTMV